MIGNTKTTVMIYDHKEALYVSYKYDNYLIMICVTLRAKEVKSSL